MDPERPQPERQPQMQRPEMQRPEMRRPDPPPIPSDNDRRLAPDPPAPPPKSGGMMLKIVAVIVLALVGYFYFGRTPSPAIGAEESSPNYQKNKNADPSVPAVFAPRDIDHARTEAAKQAADHGDPIPGVTNPSPAFIEAVKRGEVTFYAVRAYDTCAEDGDVISFQLPIGATIGPIPLTIAGTTVSIPVVAGQPASVTVVANQDGVGGVTVGVQTSGGVWFSQVMPVGGTETMALSMQ